MIISVTERQTYRRCRRKWDFSSFNRQALTPSTMTSGALDLGTLVHKSLADWIVKRKYTASEAAQLSVEAGSDIPVPEIFKLHSAVRLSEIEGNYIKLTGGAKPTLAETGPLLDVMELGIAMMENYIEHHKTPLPHAMTWVSPEQKVRVPIPNTTCEVCGGRGKLHVEHIPSGYTQGVCRVCQNPEEYIICHGCDGTGQHILEGTLDGLIQDSHGRLLILEHKTYGKRPREDVLNTNDQFIAYLWLLAKLNIGPVRGLAYDGMWKRAKPPKGSKLSDLFTRTILTRDRAEIEEFEEELIELATEMGQLNASVPVGQRSAKLYKDRVWQGCVDCGYNRLCTAMSRDEDYEYVKNNYYTKRIKEDPIGVANDDDD